MKGTAHIVSATETTRSVALEAIPDLSLLQGWVGGYIERIPGLTSYIHDPGNPVVEDCMAFCNEEGKLEHLPFNAGATHLWDLALKRIKNEHGEQTCPSGLFRTGGELSDALVGTVVILTGDEEFIRALYGEDEDEEEE